MHDVHALHVAINAGVPEHPVNMTSSIISTSNNALNIALRFLNPRKYRVVPFQTTGSSLEK